MKLLLAITGASGVVYGERLLKELSKIEDIQTEVVISEAGEVLLEQESETDVDDLISIPEKSYKADDLAAPPASGSSLYDAVLIVPCSVSTLSKIASGIADNLITRSASVAMKEGRKLILVPRETPLSTTVLRNMYDLSKDGVVILPAAPGFYGGPEDIEDLVNFIVGKILDTLGIENDVYERWD
ncbi:MAG: UbiX family flavin prenyltransferase [Candidatus Saliniplasma sp.]